MANLRYNKAPMTLAPKNGEPPAAPAGLKTLFQDSYVTVSLDESQKLIRFVRSSTPFPDLDAPRRTYEPLIAMFNKMGRQNYSILTDIRRAPGRNDPAFETLMLDLRTRVQLGFARRGTLVATAVGAMQVRRLTKEDGLERMISSDEADLLRYLAPEPKRG